ncbi:electron transport complex subunit RsxG [Gallaecimonas sp. GXIMD4217]|uniref:electron transport complex subunit RsxG n=1 Tax=Gallaecimonas sp. GXIMD4217 TaxID=3131927 RepID=UPI00311B3BE2
MISAAKKNGLILGGFALVATALLAGTHALTKDRIARQKAQQTLVVLNTLIPEARHDNDLYDDCTLVRSRQYLGASEPMPVYLARKEGQPVAAAIEAIAPDGYNGAIALIVGIDYQSETVTGVRVLEHKETPGLGDKVEIRKSDWVLSFEGLAPESEKDATWAVRKDGGRFDQFTGATITPRAVVKAVGNVVHYFRRNKDQLFSADANCRGDA